ncbi:MAG: hypothetical protein N2C13_02120, partial [Chloroflexota bacterium]
SWVMSRSLSGSWAAHDPHVALYFLKSLAAKDAPHKQVVSALRALIRHEAADAVQTEMEKWRASNDENLPVIAEKIDQ